MRSSLSFADSSAAVVSPHSSYAIPLIDPATKASDALADADGQGLIPVKYEGLSATTLADESPASASVPQSSAVEAIPTPTAFHAGGCLLLLIALTRLVKKVRWA